MSIAQKICEAMQEVGYLKKDKVLEGGARYPYLSEEQVTAETHAVFAKVGIAMMPIAVEILENRLDHTMKGGELHNTRIRTTFRLIDAEDASFMDIQTLGEGSDSGDKTLNKCMTAAYKYAIRQTLMISTGDDPDVVPSNETKSTARPPAQSVKPTTPKPAALSGWFQLKVSELGCTDTKEWCAQAGKAFCGAHDITYDALVTDKAMQKLVHDEILDQLSAMNAPFDEEAK